MSEARVSQDVVAALEADVPDLWPELVTSISGLHSARAIDEWLGGVCDPRISAWVELAKTRIRTNTERLLVDLGRDQARARRECEDAIRELEEASAIEERVKADFKAFQSATVEAPWTFA